MSQKAKIRLPTLSWVIKLSAFVPYVLALLLMFRRGLSLATIRLFADDTIVYQQIDTDLDHKIVRDDLNTLSKWCRNCSMEFNITKCHLLSLIQTTRKPSEFNYFMDDRLSSYDYLGVTQSQDLRWKNHCIKTACKANKTLGIVRRTGGVP